MITRTAAYPVGEVPRRVGHDSVRLVRQAHVPKICAYDRHALDPCKATIEFGSPPRVKLHCGHPRTNPYEGGSQRAGTRSEIDDEIGVPDPGSINDVTSRRLIEAMKSPAKIRLLRPRPSPGHDAP